MSADLGRVLVIAGSDSGGGAGIQADVKAITLMGGHAATAITAITVQNTLGVSRVEPVPLDLVEAQARAVLDDIGTDVIKTGMLGNAETVALVARLIDDAAAPAVIDPVMVAKGGASLISAEAAGAMRLLLLPRAALLTPNAPEAAALTGLPVGTVEEARIASRALIGMGAKAVLMKGGHIAGDTVVDLLVTPDSEQAFQSRRILTRHTHGTGCTLASACASGLAQGWPLSVAVARARTYVLGAILAAPGLGAGHGPLGHGWPAKDWWEKGA